MVFVRHGPLVLRVFDAVPIQPRVNGREPADFVEHIFGGFIFKTGDAKPLGNLGNNPPIRPRLALRGHRLAEALYAALGVHAHAVSFPPSGCGQHHIGEFRGFRSENIDEHQMLQRFQCVLAMRAVGVGHHCVLAIDNHGVNGFAAFI